jgi:hypothetical protein
MQYVIAKKNGDSLGFKHVNCCESRGKSVESLIRESLDKYPTTKNFSFTVGTDDIPTNEYNFSVTDNNYKKAFPCFFFDSYPEVGVNNYSALINSFIDTKPKSNKIGWIGAPMTQCRSKFCSISKDKNFCEAIINTWNRSDPNRLFANTPTYLTYQQQVDRWKYLIDFRGCGWSARTKVLLNTPRIVFIADRIYKEFWYENIKPWEHYVPVKADLSDLEENYNKIESDEELQKNIKINQKEFAKKYLSKESALLKIKEIIGEL